MTRKNKVKEHAIESKDQRWHTRNRITLVFGSNDLEHLDTYLYDDNINPYFTTIDFHQAKSKAIEEILDNSIDEFYRKNVKEIKITLKDDGKTVIVEDDGIGFDVTKIKSVYTEFRTGSKFKDGEVDTKGYLGRTLGQNGLGASATCLSSDYFKATVKHHNTKKVKTVEFFNGAETVKGNQTKTFKGKSGVKIELRLAEEVYGDNNVSKELLRKRIIDLAFNNKGLKFSFNGEVFQFKKGVEEMIEKFSNTGQVLSSENISQDMLFKKKKVKGLFDISISLSYDTSSYDKEKFVSFVNSTPTYDGGFHHDRVRRIFINKVKEKLGRECKRRKIELIDNDVVSGMIFLIGIIMPNPRFDSQTKRKLVKDPYLEKSLESSIDNNIEKYFRKNKEYLESVLEKAESRSRVDDLKKAEKKSKQNKRMKIAKLLDANEKKNRSKCTLFICEGDSAIGQLRSSRDKLYHGGIPLKGKPLNVLQASVKDVLNNQELMDIAGAVGLTIGQPPIKELLRYSSIVFLSDSDVDGGHINTLLVNFFYRFWKELFDMKVIKVTKAPLFEVISTTGSVYFAENESDLTNLKNNKKLKIKIIQRNKGLGEMSKEAWDYVVDKNDYTVIKITDKKGSEEIIETCFGKDTLKRKELLKGNK